MLDLAIVFMHLLLLRDIISTCNHQERQSEVDAVRQQLGDAGERQASLSAALAEQQAARLELERQLSVSSQADGQARSSVAVLEQRVNALLSGHAVVWQAMQPLQGVGATDGLSAQGEASSSGLHLVSTCCFMSAVQLAFVTWMLAT